MELMVWVRPQSLFTNVSFGAFVCLGLLVGRAQESAAIQAWFRTMAFSPLCTTTTLSSRGTSIGLGPSGDPRPLHMGGMLVRVP